MKKAAEAARREPRPFLFAEAPLFPGRALLRLVQPAGDARRQRLAFLGEVEQVLAELRPVEALRQPAHQRGLLAEHGRSLHGISFTLPAAIGALVMRIAKGAKRGRGRGPRIPSRRRPKSRASTRQVI